MIFDYISTSRVQVCLGLKFANGLHGLLIFHFNEDVLI